MLFQKSMVQPGTDNKMEATAKSGTLFTIPFVPIAHKRKRTVEEENKTKDDNTTAVAKPIPFVDKIMEMRKTDLMDIIHHLLTNEKDPILLSLSDYWSSTSLYRCYCEAEIGLQTRIQALVDAKTTHIIFEKQKRIEDEKEMEERRSTADEVADAKKEKNNKKRKTQKLPKEEEARRAAERIRIPLRKFQELIKEWLKKIFNPVSQGLLLEEQSRVNCLTLPQLFDRVEYYMASTFISESQKQLFVSMYKVC